MNKKLIIALGTIALSAGAFAGHCYRPAPVHHHVVHHHHDRDFWGRGGRNFWPGFVGGVIGGAVYNAVAADTVTVARPSTTVVVQQPVVQQPVIVQQPVVVPQPVVTQTVVQQPVTTVQNVWVEGRYVDQVQANGTVVRVWQPGHYEQRTVTVQ